jgi:hypothetical protein
MTLMRCPGCRNQVNRESTRCPVCGCNFVAATIRHYAKWAIVILCSLYFLHRYVIKKIPFWDREHHSVVHVVVEGSTDC